MPAKIGKIWLSGREEWIPWQSKQNLIWISSLRLMIIAPTSFLPAMEILAIAAI